MGANVVAIASIAIAATDGESEGFVQDATLVTFITGIAGAGIFNIVRSATYRKPKPQSSANATNFKPYDGLKLSILPTQSGDCKVIARYDYSF